MDETARIRLSGHSDAFEISRSARELLLDYLADARSSLATEPDGDETVRELESVIGERLRQLSHDATGPLDTARMTEVLTGMGPVESPHSAAASPLREPRGRFWCRIDSGKWFGGICLGLAARGEFRVDWVRTILFFLLLASGGLLALVYLALLLVLPRVPSVEDYERLVESPRSPA
ncbi:hypothetical protein CFK38_10535 [Brachybacterium vulturis]|uniref:Phage shock protein PspC N-terminal domain-containing protein n=1 Tax=Brachybacterium vulturis TaxID=2017484 RepID=A0A291GPK7_9MICO|nr:PspC domain-containing protein [Brachybacterium vulturis]ATG51904.1 hypothetical protein CFK38_10535 [Brachybacterium vulturis]